MAINFVTNKLPDANSVAAGSTAVFVLPIGLTYHKLQLIYSGLTLAQMTNIRIVGNGQTLCELGSGAKVDVRNQFDQLAAANGILTLNFEREQLMLPDQRMLTVLGTGYKWTGKDAYKNDLELRNLQLEIDIDAAAAAPALQLYGLQSGPQPLLFVRRVFKRTYTAGAAGEYQINDLPRNSTTQRTYNRFIIESANCTAAEIVKDNFSLFKRTKAVNELFQSDGVRTPQTDYFVIDPTENGQGSNLIDVYDCQDFSLRLTMSAGETITVWSEVLGILNT